MKTRVRVRALNVAFLLPLVCGIVNAQTASITSDTLLRIIRAEDQRRWDDELKSLMGDKNFRVRKRAALAAGRIGDQRAVTALLQLLSGDENYDVRQMAAFAIGEVESPAGIDGLLDVVKELPSPDRYETYARAVEALGKIAAALPESEKDRKRACGESILNALHREADNSQPDRLTVLLGLTATIRARPDGAGPVVARFLDSRDLRIVADALNTLARLHLKDGAERVRQLLSHSDAVVRANAVRAVGINEDKQGFDTALVLASNDPDPRVRVSAIRALASLKDKRAVASLVKRGNALTVSKVAFQAGRNELLEIVTTLGRLLPGDADEAAVAFIKRLHDLTNGEAVEVETVFARIAPEIYETEPYRSAATRATVTWRQLSRRAQGLSAIKDVATGSAEGDALKNAEKELAEMLGRSRNFIFAIPDILESYARYNPADAAKAAFDLLSSKDVIVRATAAEIIGGQKPDDNNASALIRALKSELPRTEKGELNDAVFAMLEALAKQRTAEANEAIKTALDSSDHLIRRRAVALLKANGGGDFSDRIGTVKTRNTTVDYRRAISRIGKKTTATVTTEKGSFVIEFFTEGAPLNVDNFIKLSQRGFFNGQRFPRVVPNFVIQAGDPRGDTNGGPGYQIRCEINEIPYERATVGMALSGKDTGGSQWFVTHAPQPHLDGGYTVFGHVISGMQVVDRIARGDLIVRVSVNER